MRGGQKVRRWCWSPTNDTKLLFFTDGLINSDTLMCLSTCLICCLVEESQTSVVTAYTVVDIDKQSAVFEGCNDELFFLAGSMSWLLGNAEELPVADESFDVYTVAFGIRNMTHIDTVIMMISYIFTAMICFYSVVVCVWIRMPSDVSPTADRLVTLLSRPLFGKLTGIHNSLVVVCGWQHSLCY